MKNGVVMLWFFLIPCQGNLQTFGREWLISSPVHCTPKEIKVMSTYVHICVCCSVVVPCRSWGKSWLFHKITHSCFAWKIIQHFWHDDSHSSNNLFLQVTCGMWNKETASPKVMPQKETWQGETKSNGNGSKPISPNLGGFTFIY